MNNGKSNNGRLAIIVNKVNNRPRKTLGYATPNEIFNNTS